MAEEKPQQGSRAVLYARKSTDDRQGEQLSLSVTDQIAACRDVAKQHKYVIVGSRQGYIDDSYSGRAWPEGVAYDEEATRDTVTAKYLARKSKARSRRPAFGALCDLVRQGKVDVIVVRDATRLSRPKYLSRFINWFPAFLRDHKVWIHTADGMLIAPWDEMQVMWRIMHDMFVDQELTVRAQHAMEAKRGLNREGWWTAQPPYGYRATKRGSKVYVQDRRKAAVVRRMFDVVLQGKRILRFLEDLNEEGETTARGRKWHLRQFQHTVANPLYAGLQSVGTKEHHVRIKSKSFPKPIISPAKWYEAQRILKSRSQLPPATRTSHPCSGLIRCADCGRSMQIYGSQYIPQNWRKYWCDNAYVVRGTRCKATVNVKALYRILAPLVMLKHQHDRAQAIDNRARRKRLPAMEAELAGLKESLLAMKAGADKLGKKGVSYVAALNDLDEKIAILESEIQELKALPEAKPTPGYTDFAKAVQLPPGERLDYERILREGIQLRNITGNPVADNPDLIKPDTSAEFREVLRLVLKEIRVGLDVVTITLWDGHSFPLRLGKRTHKYHRPLPVVRAVPFRGGKGLHLRVEQEQPATAPLLKLPYLLVEEVAPEQHHRDTIVPPPLPPERHKKACDTVRAVLARRNSGRSADRADAATQS